MRPSTISLLCLLAGACASATPSNNVRGDDDDTGDDSGTPDARRIDAPDVAPDAPDPQPDAQTQQPDASQGCTPTQMELLTNGYFDDEPMGNGWNETPVNDMYPLITDDTGLDPDTAPYRVWMGGIASSSDSMYQSISVPSGTTALELTGVWAVATSETTTTAMHDTASLSFTSSGGSSLETVMSISNLDDNEAFESFDYQVNDVSSMAGQTVRLYFESSNNSTKESSFYFDTFSLTATVCQ
ncbi:MAG TPA: hypothetical protein VGM88_19175 [Kofleriaceae bacterium]